MKKNKITKIIMIAVFFMLCCCTSLFAQEAPWNDTLEDVVDMLCGRTARLIFVALVALTGIAMAAIGGQGMKQKIFYLIIGGGIVFGAQNIVNMLF